MGAGGEDSCPCGSGTANGSCPLCGGEEPFRYWCDTCRQAVPEKRCPLCGLKARRMRGGGEGPARWGEK